MVGKDFGCVDYLIPNVSKRFTNDSLRMTISIILSGIDGGYTRLKRSP
jgi:hypothetical protein